MTVENHGSRFEGIPNRILQENRPRSPNFRQIQTHEFQQFLLPVNRFGIFHGRLDSGQAIKLSLDEAKQIFQSIKRACELQQTITIKTAELSWKTDARLQPTWLRRIFSDRIVIGFDGPSGFVREFVRRDVVLAAIEEFTKKFCIADVKVSLEKNDEGISNG